MRSVGWISGIWPISLTAPRVPGGDVTHQSTNRTAQNLGDLREVDGNRDDLVPHVLEGSGNRVRRLARLLLRLEPRRGDAPRGPQQRATLDIVFQERAGHLLLC